MSFGPCGNHNPAPPYNRPPRAKGEACATCRRIAIEGKIARRAIRDLLAAGYLLSVFDSEEVTLSKSADAAQIEAAMFTSDDDRLFCYWPDGTQAGWVWFVYGNGGWDVICDYTTNLENDLSGVNEYATTLED